MATQSKASRRTKSELPDFTIPIIIGLLVIRAANTYLVTTFFQPDEFYQSLEPAWQLAFGKDSGAWITWEWHEKLRSAIHPVLFAGAYKAAASFADAWSWSSSARAELLLHAPKLLQVPIAAAIDFYTWRLSQIIFGSESRESVAALLLSVWSPWQWYISTRTFSNTLETLLTVITLSYWPWEWTVTPETASASSTSAELPEIDLKEILNQNGKAHDIKQTAKKQDAVKKQQAVVEQQQKPKDATLPSLILPEDSLVALSAAALACILRPTNVIIWATIIIASLQRYGSTAKAIELISRASLAGSAVLGLSISIDMVFYGSFTIPQWNFLYFNVIQSLSVFYGRNRIDYYFTEGIPLLLTTALPFGILGFWQALRSGPDRVKLQGYAERQTRFLLALAVAVTVLLFSCIAHKEVRFIYPLLPILHVLAARPLASYFTIFPVDENKLKVGLLIIALTLNMYIMAYTALIHQRGVIDVMAFLRHEAEHGILTVGFLMPCHSTPWRSHLVYPVDVWALTCEPPLGVPAEWRSEYLDEADIFYNHPGGWIDQHMVDRSSILDGRALTRPAPKEGRRPWPDYLVFFEHLEPTMNGVLDGTRYAEHTRFFNSHWHDDWRRRGDVVVHKLAKD